ncbi:MAG: hypothetical protein VW270_04225, partial [Candidatus Poseidoniales archaeon]
VKCDVKCDSEYGNQTGICFTLKNGKVIRAWVECAWCSKKLKKADIEDIKSVLDLWDYDKEYDYIEEALNEYLRGDEE